MLSRLLELTNPNHGSSFLHAYISLLCEASKVAIYRTTQGTLAFVPMGLGLWIAWNLECPGIFMIVASITTVGMGIRSLRYKPPH